MLCSGSYIASFWIFIHRYITNSPLFIITDCNTLHTKIESKIFGYSFNKIPVPSKSNCLKSMMGKFENFIKRICWKAHFFGNPMMRDNNYTNYDLKRNVSPSQNTALTSFENDIYDMLRNTEFRNVRSDFQDRLREDINKIFLQKLIFFADRSTNLYEMSDTDYNSLLGNNITTNYRK